LKLRSEKDFSIISNLDETFMSPHLSPFDPLGLIFFYPTEVEEDGLEPEIVDGTTLNH
jgi:hypothetical protein